jgi:spermidine synthase
MTRFLGIVFVSAVIGYISLSQEILWINVMNYITGTNPRVFGYVLGWFLLGIAFGSLIGKRVCEKGSFNPIPFMASVISLSAVMYYCSLPLSSTLITYSPKYGMLLSYFCVSIIAFLSGIIFPVLSHIGIQQRDTVGMSMSWMYSANIVGSTAGPLFTSFVLLDHIGLEQAFLVISILTSILAMGFWIISPLRLKQKAVIILVMLCIITGMYSLFGTLYVDILEKLHYKEHYFSKKPYKYAIQNRHGIIAVEASQADILYGGGVYDGGYDLNPVLNSNGITRAYKVAALHPGTESVFEIGLGSGSWAKVVASHKNTKEFIIVELNPGYMELLKHYPEISDILNDRKVKISYSDGRLWLKRHPEKKFDLILINVWHWRSFSSNLLSFEFLSLCKQHLKPGGIIYCNTTGSRDVVLTASSVFKYSIRFGSYIAVSDTPFMTDYDEKLKNILTFNIKNNPVFDLQDPKLVKIVEELIGPEKYPLVDLATGRKPRVITDDNMASEISIRKGWIQFKKTSPFTKLLRGCYPAEYGRNEE